MTTVYKHYLDPVFHSPLNLSPIWQYCTLERSNTGVETPEEHHQLFRLFQVSLSALQTIYAPAGKWIGRAFLMISGCIKAELSDAPLKRETSSLQTPLNLGFGEMVISLTALLANSERAMALQSLLALYQNVHNLWDKEDPEEILELISNALYLSTFWPHSRDTDYKYTLVFLAYRAGLSAYRAAREGIDAYRNPKFRSYKILEAGFQGIIALSQIFQLHSKYQTVQRFKKEIADHAVVLIETPHAQTLHSLPIQGLENKSIRLITSDPRLADFTAIVEKPDRKLRKQDRELYDQRKQAYREFEQRYKNHAQAAFEAVEELSAIPEEGSVKVFGLSSKKIHEFCHRIAQITDNLNPLNFSSNYTLYTNKDGRWTLWEQGPLANPSKL